MTKKNLQMAIVTFVISLFFTSVITATALAINKADSSKNRYTVNGYSYDNYASIYIYPGDCAEAWGKADSISGTVPAGYIGAYAKLYNSSGQLIEWSDWAYNSSPSAGLYQSTDVYTTSGTYYSKGITRAYNGNGYNSYDTNQSPNLTL